MQEQTFVTFVTGFRTRPPDDRSECYGLKQILYPPAVMVDLLLISLPDVCRGESLFTHLIDFCGDRKSRDSPVKFAV